MKELKIKPIADLMNKTCGTNIDVTKIPDNWVLQVSETDEIAIVKN